MTKTILGEWTTERSRPGFIGRGSDEFGQPIVGVVVEGQRLAVSVPGLSDPETPRTENWCSRGADSAVLIETDGEHAGLPLPRRSFVSTEEGGPPGAELVLKEDVVPTVRERLIPLCVRPVDAFRLDGRAGVATIELFGAGEVVNTIGFEEERAFKAYVIEVALAEDAGA